MKANYKTKSAKSQAFTRNLLAGAVSSIVLANAASAAERISLEEVIVTAQKTEQNIQDTPIAISAFTSESLSDKGIQNAQDLMQYAPATHITGSRITVRGIGQEQRQFGSDPGVAMYFDGVYSANTRSLSINEFWDTERVEVLRGPQGTLFGRNTIGGAINLISKAPSAQFEGAVEVEVGEHGTEKLKVAVGGPLADNVQGRISLYTNTHDGYQSNINDNREFGDLDAQGGQASLAVQWNDDVESIFRLRGSTEDNVPRALRVVGEYDTTTPYWGSGAHNPNYAALGTDPRQNPYLNNKKKADVNPDSPMRLENDEWTFTMDNSWLIDSGELKLISSYGKTNFDNQEDADRSGSSAYSNIIDTDDVETEITTHEFQFVSDWDGDFNINTGLYYYNEDSTTSKTFIDTIDQRYSTSVSEIDAPWMDAYFTSVGVGLGPGNSCADYVAENFTGGMYFGLGCEWLAGASGSPTNSVDSAFLAVPGFEGDPQNRTYGFDAELESTSYAAFGQLEWDVTDDLHITIGMRYSEDTKKGVENNYAYTETFGDLEGIPTTFDLGGELAFPEYGMSGGRAVNYYYSTLGNANGFGFPLGVGVTDSKVDETWYSTDGKIGFDYTLDADQMIYGSVSTGYRSGGFALGTNFVHRSS